MTQEVEVVVSSDLLTTSLGWLEVLNRSYAGLVHQLPVIGHGPGVMVIWTHGRGD